MYKRAKQKAQNEAILKTEGSHMNRLLKDESDDYLLYKIAKEYFEENLIQDAIAEREHISRPHVSRLLTRARERGIVQITVVNPAERNVATLKSQFKRMTGIDYIEIAYVANVDELDAKSTAMTIAAKASEVMDDFLKESSCIGIGKGMTVYQMSCRLHDNRKMNDTTFVPVIGISASNSPYLQTNTIVDRMSNAYSAKSYYTNIPIVMDQTEEKSQMFQARYKELQNKWNDLDTVIVGLGYPYTSSKREFLLNEATDEYREVIAESNNVGDLLATFFRKDGSEVTVKSKFEKISITLRQMQKIPKVLCLAGGEGKAAGIYAAIKNRYINGLVTDSQTAECIIEIAQKDRKGEFE